MPQDPDDPSASTSSPNFDTIFADALKQYKKRTKKDIAAHSLAAQIEPCDSPNAVLTVLQTQVQTFDPSPSANEKWTRLLNPTITVLYAFSGFVNSIAEPAFPPGAAIFTGIGVLLQVVKEVRASEDILVDLFDRMKYFFMRLEKYIAVRPTAAMTDIIVQIMVEIISLLGIATKEIEQGRLNKYVKKVFGIHRVDDGFHRLDKFTQEGARMAEVEILATADHDGLASRTGNLSGKALRQWTDPPVWSSNFHSASDAHHEGTAAWCIEGKTFSDWMASGSLLWIHGKPGSGKTILSSVIIWDIKSMRNAGLAFLAYFYFDFKDEGKKDSRALLSSLLDQLSDQSNRFRYVLHGLYSEHRNGSQKPHDDALLRCLKGMLASAGSVPIYLVMDALDECPNDSGDLSSFSPRGKVLSLVKELVGLHLPNLRLCITSRPELDICTIIKPLATQGICLHDESGQNQDINAYVTFAVQSVKHWRDDDKKMVIDKLTEDADGMFRLVYCKLEVLRQCHRNDLRRILKELSQSLDETYQHILKEMNNAYRKEAHRLFQCLAVARRPLRVEELVVVLALDVDAGGIPKFNANWRLEDREAAVLSACSSLVFVVNHGGSWVVQFCHFSVKKFLMSDRLSSTEDIAQFHISHESSHVVLAQACLGVLLSEDGPTSEDSAGDIPLSGYAYEYWLAHAQVGNVELQIKEALDRFFDLDKPHFAAFFRRAGAPFKLRFFRVPSDEESKGVLTPAAPFYFAAISGLSGPAERLIVTRKPQVLVNFCSFKVTLLHLAVREGHIKAVRWLLAHGADKSCKDYATPPYIDARIASLLRHSQGLRTNLERPLDSGLDAIDDIENALPDSDVLRLDVSSEESIDADMDREEESGFTPLHLAASEGHLDICQMLLEHNADVRVHDDSGDTPLHLAASSHHLEIARILLKYKAEVNSRNEDGSTPLLIASSRGNLDILRLLLAHNADAFVHDNRGSTPLHLAAIRGHLEVARSLLELKVDVNALDDEGSTPLQRASQGWWGGYRDIMRLLLDHGANVNVHDNSGNTALYFVASSGHLKAARILLERGADVNSQNGEGLTPLQRASQGLREGHREIMRLLLDHGANVNAHDNSGNTVLHFATSLGHLEAARMLLKLGAHVNSQNDEGLTPLQLASQGWRTGHRDIMQLLLDHGANVNAHDNSGNTALYFAASSGHLEAALMLLERGADVNFQNDEGLAPLQRASQGWREGHREIMRLLLDHGTNVNAHDNSGNTVLHFVASEGHLKVARMLLKLGADVNSQNDEGLTPLQLASQGWRTGHRDIMRLLLDHGANVNVHDNSGNTALYFVASLGHLKAARILLERGADANSLNYKGLTPFQQASQGMRGGSLNIMRLLLDHGANVNAHDHSGNAALYFAASSGHLEAARMLLERGADVNSRNDEGLAPLQRASQGWREGHRDIVRLLLDCEANVNMCDNSGNTALHFAASKGRIEVVRMLLEHNAKVNSRNFHGWTPLLLASELGSPGLVELLLNHNANVHVCDAYGDTLLHCAAIAGRLEISRLLLKLGVNVNSRNNKGSTPLHLASAGYVAGNPDIVRLLLEHGAYAQARNFSGKTASEVACGHERQEIVQLLSQNDDDQSDDDLYA